MQKQVVLYGTNFFSRKLQTLPAKTQNEQLIDLLWEKDMIEDTYDQNRESFVLEFLPLKNN